VGSFYSTTPSLPCAPPDEPDLPRWTEGAAQGLDHFNAERTSMTRDRQLTAREIYLTTRRRVLLDPGGRRVPHRCRRHPQQEPGGPRLHPLSGSLRAAPLAPRRGGSRRLRRHHADSRRDGRCPSGLPPDVPQLSGPGHGRQRPGTLRQRPAPLLGQIRNRHDFDHQALYDSGRPLAPVRSPHSGPVRLRIRGRLSTRRTTRRSATSPPDTAISEATLAWAGCPGSSRTSSG
jgi:hypothetical protein